jgi:hypothetical protein
MYLFHNVSLSRQGRATSTIFYEPESGDDVDEDDPDEDLDL